MNYAGGCRCGNIGAGRAPSKAPADGLLRARQCPLCRAHATRTVADCQRIGAGTVFFYNKPVDRESA